MDRTQRVGRRHFLRTSGRAIAGLAGLLAGQPPAAWAARELSLLTAVNYAPTSDVKLAELGKRFAKLAGASVRIDHIQSVQMSAKLRSEEHTSELQSRLHLVCRLLLEQHKQITLYT